MVEQGRWETVSDAGGASANEDLVAVFERPVTTDILVLDGATSLVVDQLGADAEADGVGQGGNADVVWFVRQFAAEFERALDADTPRAHLLAQAAAAVAAAWGRRSGGRALEPWAWPVASLAWVRIAHGAAADTTCACHLSSLGDCRTLLRLADGQVRDLDPVENANEATLYDEVAALRAAGVLEPAVRFARMLPLLREQRTKQNLDPAPFVLGVQPQGPFAVREHAFDLPAGAMLATMSDGFWRPVDPYAAMTAEDLLGACARDGLAPVLGRLRAYEAGAGGAASTAVKRADDASAVLWHAPGARARSVATAP